jgi:CHAT domain-containing protein
MVDPHTYGCLQPEVLAAYVDRGLSLTERARVDAHLASCPQCVALVAGVARTVAELSAQSPDAVVVPEASPVLTRRSLAGALAAAAAVIAVLAAPSMVRPWLDRDAGLVSLVESAGEQRSVLGRLTGGFPHAPLGAPSAGGQDGQASGSDRVQLIAGKIRESFGERVTPSQLHALGVSQLLAGRYDDAAQSLLAASREQPANAKYLNDVATVQLERARRGLRPDDLPRALAAADRARYLDPSLKEAWFNRALALSSLSLRDQAREAWTEYLRRDSTSPWAIEAKTRLEELTRTTTAQAWVVAEGRLQQSFDASTAEDAVRTHTTEARKYLETILFAEWSQAVTAGDDGAPEFERLRIMSEAMLRVTGDALYVDAANAIDRAGRDGAQRQLAAAHQQYAVAASLFARDQFADAVAPMRAAKEALAAAKTPFAVRSAIDLASLVYAGGAYAEIEQLLSETLVTARQHQYSFVDARATWIEGLTAFMQGRLGDAQAKYEDTLATFTRAGDEEQIAASHALLGGLFYYLGAENEALSHFVPALKGLELTRSLRLRHILLTSATLALRQSNTEAALAVQEETVRNAQQWGLQYAIAEALALRASLLAQLGLTNDAESDLNSAQQLSSSAEPSIKSRLEIQTLLVESQLRRAKNPAAAAAAAKQGIALVEARGDRYRLSELQLELANANVALGRHDEAETALNRGIRTFDEERASLKDEFGASSRDAAWGLFETGVHLAIKKRDLERAFQLAERARVRSLAEARRMPVPRTLASVQQGLDDSEAIIALNQFDDELAVWVIRRTGSEVVTRPLSRLDAERLVARQRADIQRQSISTDAGRALYNEILRPVTRQLAGVSRLIVVPDTTYEAAAFGALWDSTTRRFLIENLTLNLAPSANAFVAARHIDRVTAEGTPLVFGGTSLAAIREAQAIGSAYPSASVVAGTDATRSRFFSDLSAPRRIVHIAVPVAASTSNPLLSRALVADEPGRRHSGTILGSDIANSTLSQTRLVVIDEVERDSAFRGEGTLSLARAFMAAGVPAAVGTLPGADENATRDLMIGFHREMSKGMSAEQALHTVQRNAIEQNGRRLGAWSALVIYGSDR